MICNSAFSLGFFFFHIVLIPEIELKPQEIVYQLEISSKLSTFQFRKFYSNEVIMFKSKIFGVQSYGLPVLCFSSFFVPLYINTMLQHSYKINISASFITKASQFCSKNINHSNCTKLILYIQKNLLVSANWKSISH